MSDCLTTYPLDHLDGAAHAIEVLKAMRHHRPRQPLGSFAAELLMEVEADRGVLAGLAERAGNNAGGIKEWGADRAKNQHEKVEQRRPEYAKLVPPKSLSQ